MVLRTRTMWFSASGRYAVIAMRLQHVGGMGKFLLTWGCNESWHLDWWFCLFIFLWVLFAVFRAVECSAYRWNIKQLPPWHWYVIFHHLVCLDDPNPPMRPVHGGWAMLCRICMWSGLFSWYKWKICTIYLVLAFFTLGSRFFSGSLGASSIPNYRSFWQI